MLLNRVLWNKNVTKRKNKCTYNTIIKSITTYGSDKFKKKIKKITGFGTRLLA
jgi:hypothetical protein